MIRKYRRTNFAELLAHENIYYVNPSLAKWRTWILAGNHEQHCSVKERTFLFEELNWFFSDPWTILLSTQANYIVIFSPVFAGAIVFALLSLDIVSLPNRISPFVQHYVVRQSPLLVNEEAGWFETFRSHDLGRYILVLTGLSLQMNNRPNPNCCGLHRGSRENILFELELEPKEKILFEFVPQASQATGQ